MKTAITVVLAVVVILECVVFGPRLYKDYHKKMQYKNSKAE